MQTLILLGQAAPAPAVLTTLYTVPAARQTVVSTLAVANSNLVAVRFRISVAVGGAPDNIAQYLYHDVLLAARASLVVKIGATLQATDQIRVQSTVAGVAFNAFGDEVS